MDSGPPIAKGRGAQTDPPNRFAAIRLEVDLEQSAGGDDDLQQRAAVPTQYFADDTQSIVSENDSPDIGFRYTMNPYRGCSHGCAYCYARPSHEYLGLGAGLDFESKILVKQRAPELLRDWLARDAWEPATIGFSGVTDCYQPVERTLQLTRRCLAVACEARQPVAVITKNALVARDRDLLAELARWGAVQVSVSLTTLDRELARSMEPRTSTPAARLRTMAELREAGVPVHAVIAPIIPGLNDSEIARLCEAVAGAGAQSASYTLLRLPLSVRPVFLEWLARTQPLARRRVESRIASCRGGAWNDSRFGYRMRGEGPLAEQIAQTFAVFARKYGLADSAPCLEAKHFRRPRPRGGQLRLF